MRSLVASGGVNAAVTAAALLQMAINFGFLLYTKYMHTYKSVYKMLSVAWHAALQPNTGH